MQKFVTGVLMEQGILKSAKKLGGTGQFQKKTKK